MSETTILCECGCGQKIPPIDNRGRTRRYVFGHQNKDKVRSDKHRFNLSKALIGNQNCLGRVTSEATKKKIGKSNTGHNVTEKTRQKISNANTGNKHTEEAKKRISDAGKGRKMSEYNKQKLKKANTGRIISEETRKKLSDSHKGYKHTEYSKKRMSEKHKGINHWNYGGTLSEVTKKKISDGNRGKIMSAKAKIKIGNASRGDKNKNWKGGISFEPYCPKFNNKFKEEIREKFHRMCFICGISEEEHGTKLCVHHVNYNKNCLCDDVACEFVPLCMSCHAKTSNGDRIYWTQMILEKLNIQSPTLIP